MDVSGLFATIYDQSHAFYDQAHDRLLGVLEHNYSVINNLSVFLRASVISLWNGFMEFWSWFRTMEWYLYVLDRKVLELSVEAL